MKTNRQVNSFLAWFLILGLPAFIAMFLVLDSLRVHAIITQRVVECMMFVSIGLYYFLFFVASAVIKAKRRKSRDSGDCDSRGGDSGGTTSRRAGRIFYCAAIASLLVSIATTFVQKRHESAVATAGTTTALVGEEGADVHQSNVRINIEVAERWRILSLAAITLGMSSWGVAIWRREKNCCALAGVVVLLSLAVMLQLTMV